MEVCVTGATGFVGGRLLPELLAAGHDVTVLVRDADRFRRGDGPSDAVRIIEGDLLEAGSFDAALDVDAAYYLVHSMGEGGGFAERDRRAARNFRDAADDAGLDRVVYLGGLGGEDVELSEHLRSRREVERVLGEGTYEVTTLRAAVIVGAGSASFDIVDQLVHRLPVMVTPRWVRTPCQPIAIGDALSYLVGVLERPETAGETFEIGGPEVLSYEAMLRRTADVLGRRLLIVPVPVLSPRLSAYWLDLVTDVPPGVAHPLIEGLRTPVVVTDDSIREYVDVDPTAFDDAVRTALRERGRLPDEPPAEDGERATGGSRDAS